MELKREFDIGSIEYATFIAPLEKLSIIEGNIEIRIHGAYTEIEVVYITKKWGGFMKRFLNDVLKMDGEVRFLIQDEKTKKEVETELEEKNNTQWN